MTTAVEAINQAQFCFISNIVLCDIVCVLRGKPYQYSQEEILKTLELMLATAKFEFENRSAIAIGNQTHKKRQS
jgi:predicted nucleic-acid-binding protein